MTSRLRVLIEEPTRGKDEAVEKLTRYVPRYLPVWYAQGKPLGNWTIPYLLRHTAYSTTPGRCRTGT
ncbi:MAG: hypothetical protein M3Q61_06050 [Chloroflexota bacterium]|nr:hypothetical protein [Chloroflexota bacterium]